MFVLIPILLFIILFAPYLTVIPGNDGGLEYLFAYQWYKGQNLLHILSLHPPLKLILYSIFFKLFGFQSTAYIGLLFGIAGIYALYIIGCKLFNKKVALLSCSVVSIIRLISFRWCHGYPRLSYGRINSRFVCFLR